MKKSNKHSSDRQEVEQNTFGFEGKNRHSFLLKKWKSEESLSPAELKELRIYEGNPDIGDEQIVKSIASVARIFNVSTRQVDNWIKAGMPRTPNGNYDLGKINQWRTQIHKQENKKPVDSFEIDYRRTKWQLAELELGKKRGELVPLSQVIEELGEEIIIIKQKFLAAPSQLAPQLVGLEVHDIEAIIRSKLTEIIKGFAAGKYGAGKED